MELLKLAPVPPACHPPPNSLPLHPLLTLLLPLLAAEGLEDSRK